MHQDRRIYKCVVKRNALIAEDVYEMAFETAEINSFIPGQFINVYLEDKSMLLPRPISISEVSYGRVTLIYKAVGKGTRRLSEYAVNEPITVSPPLGNGYRLLGDYSGGRIALVAGGMGIPPMAGLAMELQGRNARADVYLGFRSGVFLLDKFIKTVQNVFISTDDGSEGFHGNIVEMLKSSGWIYDEYFSCGPKAMLKALSEYAGETGRGVQASVEERMGCGYGACVGCSCKISEGGGIVNKSVCKHGPVFAGKDVVWD